jgi:hypothetical protein
MARSAIAAMVAIFLLSTICLAQGSTQSRNTAKKNRGPRAIAVLEMLPGGQMRLVPVALLLDGKYYDASLYAANPVPMAVEPDTVYEAQSFGEPTGTFTIESPTQVNGNWVADGSWQPELPMDEKLKAQAAKEAAYRKEHPVQAVTTADADSGRPVLKRAPGSAGDTGSSTQPAQSTQSTTSNDSDRPTLKRPGGDSSSTSTTSGGSSGTTAKSQTQVDDHDPDRPVMKRSSPAEASSSSGTSSADSAGVTPAAAASDDSDPNRPVLSRNKTPQQQKAENSDFPLEKPGAPPVMTTKGARSYPAISDASTYHGRPMLYSMTPAERQTQEQQVLKLALDQIRAFALKHNGPVIPKTAAITDYDVRAFDLDYSSSPTIVLTAKLPVTGAKVPPNFSYFVTVVARVDINDQAQKLFSSVTDTRHLDAYPRFELIDAVDADANGRGDLLFRQYSDVGISYALYRVTAYQIEKVFEGGAGL